MANSISQNNPDSKLIILLIDERPEEVTDMQRNTQAEDEEGETGNDEQRADSQGQETLHRLLDDEHLENSNDDDDGQQVTQAE
jgi:hypothetical protein